MTVTDSYATPEQSFGKDDRPLSRIPCEKNPKHANFIPLQKDTTLPRFPKKLRNEIFKEVILLLGLLTVKIEVFRTSSKRLTSDPVWTMDAMPRVGTGSVLKRYYQVQNGETADSKQYYEFYVETNRHVVFDEEEARSSVVYFFTGRGKVAFKQQGHRTEHSAVPGDYTSYLICRTDDKQFVERLNERQREFAQKVESLPRAVKIYLTKKVAVVGFPHGAGLTVSFGKSTVLHVTLTIDGRSLNVKKISNYEQVVSKKEWVRKTLTYIADTCPGLSGAPILRFRMCQSGDDVRLDLDFWMHSGVLRDDVFNVSVMKECTTEELHSWGISTASPACHHISWPATNKVGVDGTLPNHSPRTVDSFRGYRTPPAYPVYVSFQKRFESFINWTAHHIASPNDLSCSGFFYAGYSDCVRCFQCGLGLRSWKPGDNIDEEHERHRPTCPFLQDLLSLGALNRPLLAESEIRHDPRTSERSKNTSSQASPGHGLITPLDSVNKLMCLQTTEIQVYNVSVTHQLQQTNAITDVTTNLGWNERTPVDDAPTAAIPNSNTEVSLAPSFNDEKDSQIVTEVKTTLSQNVAENVTSVNSTARQPTESREALALRLLQKEQQVLKKLMMCKMCKEAPIRDLFLPCGELYACSECSGKLSHCPVCNGLILGTVTTFFS